MTRGKTVCLWKLVAGATVALTAYCGAGEAAAADLTSGTWTGGAALGFLANTADGTAAAVNLNVERFFSHSWSLGPLLQLGFTGDLAQLGVSAQVKYWMPLAVKDLKLNVQGGIGFVHTDFHGTDTSFLVPIGAGLDYTLTNRVSATANFLLNFTDIDTGSGKPSHVMPGLTFGLRF